MKKRVLACGEFSQLSTGYAVYMRGLLNFLHKNGYEIIELACACIEGDPRLGNVPWTVIPNIPHESNKAERDKYNSFFSAEFGAWQFEELLLKYKPDIVLDIRDNWHYEYQLRSPLRDYYASVIMPAIDAEPQNKCWLNFHSKADAVLSYTQWGIDIMNNSGFKINTMGATPPIAPNEFIPLNKALVKKEFGFEDKIVIGMVGRNQKRKLFPDLFKSFSAFLNKTGRTDTILYIHTKHPDRGWEIDEEILKYDIANKVYLTYVCENCRLIKPSIYKGVRGYCERCGYADSSVTANSDFGIPNSDMAKVYNSMDLYVQWHTNEGYGIPVMEALACGVPIVGVDYSAVSEILDYGGGKKIKPIGFTQEIESGRKFAVPDNKELAKYLEEFCLLPSSVKSRMGVLARLNYEKNWSIEKTYGTWIKAIESVKSKKGWDAAPNIHNIPTDYPKNLDNKKFAEWLILVVLNRREYIGSEMHTRLIRDLNNGISPGGFGGNFYHEISASSFSGNRYIPFKQEDAFNVFKNMAMENNYWEDLRIKSNVKTTN